MFRRLFYMDLKRAVGQKKFWITCAGIFLMTLLSSYWMMQSSITIVELYEMLLSCTGGSALVLWLFPLIPFSLSYASDAQSNVLKYIEVRTPHPHRVVLVRFLVSCLSAFLCIIAAFTAFFIFLKLAGFPLVDWKLYEMDTQQMEGYYELLQHGRHAFEYIAMIMVDQGLIAVMMSASAFFVSVWTEDTFISFTAPVCIYFVVLRTSEVLLSGTGILSRYRFLDPSRWVEGTYDSPHGAWASLLMKLGVAVLVAGGYLAGVMLITKKRGKRV